MSIGLFFLTFALGIVTPWGEDLRAALFECSWEQGFVLGGE